MNTFIILFSLISILLFYCISVYLAYKEEDAKITLMENYLLYKQKLYELSILKSIQKTIGYSLDEEKLIDMLTSSLKSILPFSATASLYLKEDRIVFKVYIEEKIGNFFLEEVKNTMLASLSAMVEQPLPSYIEEVRTGVLSDQNSELRRLNSFFNIPLLISGHVVGLINISSTKAGLYKEEEMSNLYQIIHQAAITISQLKEVTNAEKQKLISFISSLADGILLIDKDNQISVVNQAARNILELGNKELNIFDLIGMFSNSFDLRLKIQEAKDKNTIIEEKNIALKGKNLQITITPVQGTINQPENLSKEIKIKSIGVSILLHDTTLENELAKMKEDFTNAIVHELRSPLTAIQGSSTIMMMGNITEEEKQKFLSIINIQSKKLLMTISSILDASKLENGKFVLNKQPQELNNTINETLDLFWADAKTKGIQILTDIEPNLPKVLGDQLRLSQVFNNLLSNSLKFTSSPGTITISAKYFDQANFPRSATNPGILVTVSDTGIGIPKDKQNLLFSKFSQLNSATTKHAGSGLGLFISKNIIEAHGGIIGVNSEENKGTSVFFTLPIIEGRHNGTHEYEKGLLLPNESFARTVN